jgi:hypothetical protein
LRSNKAEYICADQPVTLIFRLRQSGGPYIPVCPSETKLLARRLHQRQLWWAGTVIATTVGVADRRPEANLASPILWSDVPVAASLDWRTRRHRAEQGSN